MKQTLSLFSCPAEFSRVVGPWLQEDEVKHNLPLGVLDSLVQGSAPYEDEPLMATFQERDSLVMVLIMTPPFNLIVCAPPDLSDESMNRAAEKLMSVGLDPPGIIGVTPPAHEFARLWSQQAGWGARTDMRQRIYSLSRVSPIPLSPGCFRQARWEDKQLVSEWMRDFWLEALPREPERDFLKAAQRLIRGGTLFLWEIDRPVSMAASSRTTGGVSAINLVFTPPEYRGQGYATSCVHALSQRLLQNYRHCVLYTDADNPTSNSIYRRIGYTHRYDSAMIAFEKGQDKT